MADGELIFDTKINAEGFVKGIEQLNNITKKSATEISEITGAAANGTQQV